MLEPILIQGIQPGGQLTITTDVENYPGFADVIQGPWLMEQMQKQAEHVGTKIVTDHVAKVDLSRRPFRLECDSGDVYVADALIIATGAQAHWLDLPSRAEIPRLRRLGLRHLRRLLLSRQGGAGGRRRQYRGRGSAVPHQFRRQGDLVHRRDSFRAEKILQERLFKNPKIEVLWDTVLDEVLGDREPLKVTHARLSNVKTGDDHERAVDGVFIAIGHSPATELFPGQLEMKPTGYIKTAPHSTATSVAGVFAAGDVTDDVYRQAVTAAGMGCMAALEAERFLAAHGEAEPRVAAE